MKIPYLFKECPVSEGGAGEYMVQKYEVLTKHALLAPIWTRTGVPYTVFREESDGDIPGAQFLTKTTKNEQTNFESKMILFF